MGMKKNANFFLISKIQSYFRDKVFSNKSYGPTLFSIHIAEYINILKRLSHTFLKAIFTKIRLFHTHLGLFQEKKVHLKLGLRHF
jgi:hypothetical protein